jgi:hypothetical protein
MFLNKFQKVNIMRSDLVFFGKWRERSLLEVGGRRDRPYENHTKFENNLMLGEVRPCDKIEIVVVKAEGSDKNCLIAESIAEEFNWTRSSA